MIDFKQKFLFFADFFINIKLEFQNFHQFLVNFKHKISSFCVVLVLIFVFWPYFGQSSQISLFLAKFSLFLSKLSKIFRKLSKKVTRGKGVQKKSKMTYSYFLDAPKTEQHRKNRTKTDTDAGQVGYKDPFLVILSSRTWKRATLKKFDIHFYVHKVSGSMHEVYLVRFQCQFYVQVYMFPF